MASSNEQPTGLPVPTIRYKSEEPSLWYKCMRLGHSIRVQITIEPPLFLFVLGLAMGFLPDTQILTDKICRQNYETPRLDCDNLKAYPDTEDAILKEASYWNLVIQLASGLPSLLSMLLWSAWADKTRDRIIVMVIPTVGFAISNFAFALEAAIVEMPIWLLIFAHMIMGILGSVGLFMNSSSAYLNDVVRDRKYLTIRLGFIMVCFYLGFILAGLINGALSPYLSIPAIKCISLGLFVISITWLSFGVRQPKTRAALLSFKAHESVPHDMSEEIGDTDSFTTQLPSQRSSYARQGSSASVDTHDAVNYWPDHLGTKKKPKRSVFKETYNLLKACWRTYTRPREQNKRLYMLLLLLTIFLANVGENGTYSSKYLFLKRHPLSFSLEDYSYFSGVSAGIQLVAMIILTVVMKALDFADTSLVLIGLVSATSSMFVFGSSTTETMVWVSAILGAVQNLIFPAFSAILLNLAEPSERGRIIAGNGVAAGIASLFASSIFSLVFAASEKTCPGLAWYISGGLIGLSFFLMLYLWFALRFLHEELTVANERRRATLSDNSDNTLQRNSSSDDSVAPNTNGSVNQNDTEFY